MKSIQEMLDRARERGLIPSDNKLAAELGLNSSTVNFYRNRGTLPDDETMVKLADLAGVDRRTSLLLLNLWRAKGRAAREVYGQLVEDVSMHPNWQEIQQTDMSEMLQAFDKRIGDAAEIAAELQFAADDQRRPDLAATVDDVEAWEREERLPTEAQISHLISVSGGTVVRAGFMEEFRKVAARIAAAAAAALLITAYSPAALSGQAEAATGYKSESPDTKYYEK